MNRNIIPEIKPLSRRLVYICLATITTYIICAAIYAKFANEPLIRTTATQIIHSAFSAAVISLGGGLLLDCEIRRTENTNR